MGDTFDIQAPRKNRASLKKRAQQRDVIEVIPDQEWKVLGSEKLRDAYDSYQVTIDDTGDGPASYVCACTNLQWGHARRNGACSHVTAVIMCRRGEMKFKDSPLEGVVATSVSGGGPGGGDVEGRSIRGSVDLSATEPPPTNTLTVDDDGFYTRTVTVDPSGPAQIPRRQAAGVPDSPVPSPLTGGVNSDSPRSEPTLPLPDPSSGSISSREAGEEEGYEREGFRPPMPLRSLPLPLDPPDPHDDIFGTRNRLPAQFKQFRPAQWQAIVDIYNRFVDGAKVVFLSAPTGSGKTLIGETINRLVTQNVEYADPNVYAPYVCTTKSLQDQISRDFGYSKRIKGKSNYRPVYNIGGATCDDCDGNPQKGDDSCSLCPSMRMCPYRVAREEAARAPLPVLNTAYYLGVTSNPVGPFSTRPLVVIDEADELESQLMGHIEVALSPTVRRQIGLKTLPKKTVPNDWQRWITEDVLPKLFIETRRLEGQQQLFSDEDGIKKRRAVKRLKTLERNLKSIVDDLTDGWVFTGYEGAKDESNVTVTFKPIMIDTMAHEYLWNRADRFLLMSATMISPEQMAADLGLDDDEWAYVEMGSSFPPESRPVLYAPAARVTWKTKDEAYPRLADRITELGEEYPHVRMLVHTHSFALNNYLMENIERPTSHRLVSYSDGRERERALKQYLGHPDAILLAPSFARGIDLPDDDCRVIVIAKVPYPYLKDKQIGKRLETGKLGQRWYSVQTIREIAQMTGRGMRHKDDAVDTYILDESFKSLWDRNKKLFPSWWAEALALSRNNPKYRGLWNAAEERQGKYLEHGEFARNSLDEVEVF